MIELRSLVLSKIDNLGVKAASVFFGVSVGTISNWASGKTDPSITAAQLALVDAGLDEPHPKQDLAMWDGKDVMLLLPVYRTFNPTTHYTLFANYAKYGPDKLGLEYKTRTVIHESRNILIDAGMKTKAKTFIMFDDDMVLPCGMPQRFNNRYNAKLPTPLASQVAISRLMSHGSDKGVVGALYFGRTPKGHAQCCSGFTSDIENENFHKLTYSGLKKEDWVATGGIKIERWAIEEMRKAIDGGKWPELKPQRSDRWYGYFTPLAVGVGEDVSFGRRAAELGIQSYVDTSLVAGHADGNYIWWHWNTQSK